MSQENVEIVREAFDAYNRDDLEASLDCIAPDFEFLPSGLFVDTNRVYRGREGWTEFWHAFRDAWDSITINVERIEDVDEQVLVLGTFHGKGHEGGVEVTRESAWLQALRGGLTAQTQTFAGWDEALEATSLSE